MAYFFQISKYQGNKIKQLEGKINHCALKIGLPPKVKLYVHES